MTGSAAVARACVMSRRDSAAITSTSGMPMAISAARPFQ